MASRFQPRRSAPGRFSPARFAPARPRPVQAPQRPTPPPAAVVDGWRLTL